MIEIAFFVIILALLTFASGFFSASETALFSISPMKVKVYRTSEEPIKRLIASLVMNPSDLLVTLLMLNVVTNILIQNLASNIFGDFSGWSLKVGVPLALTLIFGEILPKSIAISNNVQIAHFVSPTISRAQYVLGPLRRLVTTMTQYSSRFLFFFLKKEEGISKDELVHVLDSSEQQGILNPSEADLMEGYLNLKDHTVKELMRSREEIITYQIERPLEDLRDLFIDQECSRIPVIGENIDDMKGMITARCFFLYCTELSSKEALLEHLDKVHYVPETTLARSLLLQMAQKNSVIAMVVDEYGSISGLITLEDLVEVVVGDIDDRRDVQKLYTPAGKNIIIASAKLEISDFEEIFTSTLPNPHNCITVGGWLISELGDIPISGTKHEIEGYLFHVLAAEPNRIRRLYIRKLEDKHHG